MAYDEKLVDRIRGALPPKSAISEKKMFGGVAFLVDGKMFIGVNGTDLMVRVGPDEYDAALARPHVRPMDFTGRPLTGYVYVSAAGSKTTAAVRTWASKALAFVETLPTKKPKRRVQPGRSIVPSGRRAKRPSSRT